MTYTIARCRNAMRDESIEIVASCLLEAVTKWKRLEHFDSDFIYVRQEGTYDAELNTLT